MFVEGHGFLGHERVSTRENGIETLTKSACNVNEVLEKVIRMRDL